MPNNLAIEIHLAGRSACQKCGDWLQDIEITGSRLSQPKVHARACMRCLAELLAVQGRLYKLREELLARGVPLEAADRAIRAELDGECVAEPN